MNVAFIIFNRPGPTRKVFQRIAASRPENLFLIADGPRNEQESEMCRATRRVVESVDWNCNVRRVFSDRNMGCRGRVISGLDLVFSEVEDAIILEDDCLPDPTFFPFCQEMLERYRHDSRVGQVSGSNLVRSTRNLAQSYYFSKYCMIWGWATWRRSWQKFDAGMRSWPQARAAGRHHDMFPTRATAFYFEDVFEDAYQGKNDVWGIQWFYTFLSNSMLSVFPRVNLVSNLGFGGASSRTRNGKDSRANVPSGPLELPLIHPDDVVANQRADHILATKHLPTRPAWHIGVKRALFNRHFYGRQLRRLPLLGKLWGRIRD